MASQTEIIFFIVAIETTPYLHFDVSNFIYSSDYRSANHRWENVSWKIATGISAFDEL